MQQALQQLGGATGLAVLITLAVRAAHDDIAAGVSAPAAITAGYVLANQVGAGVLLVGLVLAVTLMRNGTQNKRAGGLPAATATG